MIKHLLALIFRRKKKNDAVNDNTVIQIEDLPDWAKKGIRRAGKEGTTLLQHGQDVVSIRMGEVFYNGKRAVHPGEVIGEFETELLLSTLPTWAKDNIHKNRGGIAMTNSNGNTLQINGEVVYFNGKRVVMD